MVDFDQDKPAASTSLRASNPQILDNQEALQDAINREHIFSGTSAGTQTGDHTQGSARAFSQESAPTTRIDGDNFLSTDLGSLWTDTDDNQLYILTATLPTWTPISTELYETFLANPRVFLDTLGVDGNFEVGTASEFTVDAATGNTATAGTLEATGLTTVADGSLTKTVAVATAAAEIANLATVDAQIADSKPTAKAWCQFDEDGNLETGGLNVASVGRDSEGVYTITLTTPFADTNYAPMVTAIAPNSTTVRFSQANTLAVGSFKVSVESGSSAPQDTACSVTVFGNQ